jgi:Exostosin family
MHVNIIGNAHDLNAAQEIWFIQNVLFAGAKTHIGFDPNLLNHQTIVYLELNEISPQLIEYLRLAGNKIVIYHMGDEFGRMNRSEYQNCDLVIRNYFFTEALRKTDGVEVIWAPCGFKTGVGPRFRQYIKPANQRQWLSCFLGWITNSNSYQDERRQFSEITTQCEANLFLLPTTGFSEGWNVGLYSIAMESSIFAPCPAGNAPETIRLYDALEVGCIPISLSHEFLLSPDALAFIGPVPFPIIGSWAELPKFLELMKERSFSNPNEILELQERCISWWSDYKLAIQKKIAARIEAL